MGHVGIFLFFFFLFASLFASLLPPFLPFQTQLSLLLLLPFQLFLCLKHLFWPSLRFFAQLSFFLSSFLVLQRELFLLLFGRIFVLSNLSLYLFYISINTFQLIFQLSFHAFSFFELLSFDIFLDISFTRWFCDVLTNASGIFYYLLLSTMHIVSYLLKRV